VRVDQGAHRKELWVSSLKACLTYERSVCAAVCVLLSVFGSVRDRVVSVVAVFVSHVWMHCACCSVHAAVCVLQCACCRECIIVCVLQCLSKNES